MRSLIAIAALMACSGAWSGSNSLEQAIGELVIDGVEVFFKNKANTEMLELDITFEGVLVQCAEKSAPETEWKNILNDCGGEDSLDVLDDQQKFAKAEVKKFKKCWKAADKLAEGDEVTNARGQCTYELESTARRAEELRKERDPTYTGK